MLKCFVVTCLLISTVGGLFKKLSNDWLSEVNTAQLNYGVAVTDVDDDGFMEWIVAGFSGKNFVLKYDQTSRKLKDIAQPGTPFAELADRIGNARGVCACDIDGDGREEIYITNANGARNRRSRHGDRLYKWRNGRYENILKDKDNEDLRLKIKGGYSVACLDRFGTGRYGFVIAVHARSNRHKYHLVEVNWDDPTNDVIRGKIVLQDAAEEAGIARSAGGRGVTVGPLLNTRGRSDIFFNNGYSHKTRGHSANVLYQNIGNGKFVESTKTVLKDTHSNGRGTSLADFNHDGKLDIVVTNWFGQDKVFLQTKRDGFIDFEVTPFTGYYGSSTTASLVKDFDGDGNLEVYMNKLYHFSQSSNKLYRVVQNSDKTVAEEVDVGDATELDRYGTGGGVGDVDFDGRLDMLLSHGEVMVGPVEVYTVDQNQRFLRVMPQTIYYAPARGATVTLVTTNGHSQTRIIDCGSGYLNQMEPIAHFGLNGTLPLQVTIQWPDGQVYSYVASEDDVNTLHKIALSANKVYSDEESVIKYRYETNHVGTGDVHHPAKSDIHSPTTVKPKSWNQGRNIVATKLKENADSQSSISDRAKQRGSSQSGGAAGVQPTTTSFYSKSNSEETMRSSLEDLRVPLVATSYERVDNRDNRAKPAVGIASRKTTSSTESHDKNQPVSQVHSGQIEKDALPSDLPAHGSRRKQTSTLSNVSKVSTNTERHKRPSIVDKTDKSGTLEVPELATNTFDELPKTGTFPVFRQRPKPTAGITLTNSKDTKISSSIQKFPYAARIKTDRKENEVQATRRPTPAVNARKTDERHNSKWNEVFLPKTLTPFVDVILSRGIIRQQEKADGNKKAGTVRQTFPVSTKGQGESDQTTRNVKVPGRGVPGGVARTIPKLSSTGFRIRWVSNERGNPDQRVSKQRQHRASPRQLEQKRRQRGLERRARYRSGIQTAANKNTNDNRKVKQSALTGIAKSGVRYIFWNRSFKLCKITVSHWQPCSRTCGGGTSSRMSNDNSRCFLRKEHKRCNVEPCSRSLNDARQRAEKPKATTVHRNHKGRQAGTSNIRRRHNQHRDRQHRNNDRVRLQREQVIKVNDGNSGTKFASFERSSAKNFSPRNDRLLRGSSLRRRTNSQISNTKKLPTTERASHRNLPVAKAQNKAVWQRFPQQKHRFLSDDAGIRLKEQQVSTKTQEFSASEVLATSVKRNPPSSMEAEKDILSKGAKSCSSSKPTRVHHYDCSDSAKLMSVCCAYEKFRPCEQNNCPFKAKFLCSGTRSLDYTCLCPRNCK